MNLRAAIEAPAPPNHGLSRRLVAEALGTGFLLAAVVGSGIMGERLADGNMALALLANALATGAILVVLIEVFGPISGAHFNPAVTLSFALQRKIRWSEAAAYGAVQIVGAIAGVLVAHIMFDEAVFQISHTARTGPPQWLAEVVATFGLVATIIGCLRARPAALSFAVGLYISAAYWFTASTSFANPAVTIARGFTDTFSGIRPIDAPAFIAAEIVGAVAVTVVFGWLYKGQADQAGATAETTEPAGD